LHNFFRFNAYLLFSAAKYIQQTVIYNMGTMQEYPPQPVTHNNHALCPWRLISNGLNIEGLCKNFQCTAYNQMVIINLGVGEFDFARIILERKNRCPICKERIHPIKYAFNQCRWWYVNHYSTHTFPLNTVKDAYELNDLNCEYTIVETMPLPENYRIQTTSKEVACPICLISVENDSGIIHLRCSHSYHRGCIIEWLQSNQSMAKTCPLCRVRIVDSL
jgi:hypothetical protein